MKDEPTLTSNEGVPLSVLADGSARPLADGARDELRSYPDDYDGQRSDRLPVPTQSRPDSDEPPASASSRELSSFGAQPGKRYQREAPAIAVPEGRGAAGSPLELRTQLTVPPPPPAEGFWRRVLRRGPAPDVVRRHLTRSVMQTMLAQPVTIVLAQPKGGAGKTPTAIGIASAIGAARAGDVCAWDNSEIRGTLGLRVRREPHDRSVADLLSHLSWFENDRAANVLALEWLMHRQDAGFRVLTTDPLHASRDDNLDDPTWLTGRHFRRIHRVLTRFFPVVVIDNGQSELANWRASIDVADVIVVPLQLRQDHLNLAAEMINDLKRRFGQREGELLDDPNLNEADRATIHAAHDVTRKILIVISNGSTRPEPGVAEKAADWFGAFRSVQVPYDKAIDREAPMLWEDLRQATRDAYDRTGATAMSMATANTNNNPTPTAPKETPA